MWSSHSSVPSREYILTKVANVQGFLSAKQKFEKNEMKYNKLELSWGSVRLQFKI